MGVDPPSLPSGSSAPAGPSSTTADPPPFAPSWRVHSADSGLWNRAVAQEIIHHVWLLSDAQTLRAIPLEAIDRDQSATIYQVCPSASFVFFFSMHITVLTSFLMLSTALERLMGVQAVALESKRLMVAAQNERDAAITAKTEMEGQLKAADEKLLELMQKVIRDKLVGSSGLAPPVASSIAPAPPEVASSSLAAPSEVASSTPSPSAPSNNPDAASEDLRPSEG
ncbi:hypothetical protein NE237_027328 [Protea cynaroides]|uniref:Uncharacterized protein n=1 Tax=Protea cynaroides TaxID=273540 RepID=A0A9Q0GMB9_9MAGN|nr:hypothetical protein NE237_027328 [Protea cynaroides]